MAGGAIHASWGRPRPSAQGCPPIRPRHAPFAARDNQTRPPFLSHQAHAAPSLSPLSQSSIPVVLLLPNSLLFVSVVACPVSLPCRLFAIYPLVEDLPQRSLSPPANSSDSGCILCHLHAGPALALLSRLTRSFWTHPTLSPLPPTSTAHALRLPAALVSSLSTQSPRIAQSARVTVVTTHIHPHPRQTPRSPLLTDPDVLLFRCHGTTSVVCWPRQIPVSTYHETPPSIAHPPTPRP